MGKSVFISYSSKDERYIKKMTQMLEKMGISYWIAPDMIPAGSNYAREIPKAIRDCEIFLRRPSSQSGWKRRLTVPFITGKPLCRFRLMTV